jgi:hypothetical protein
MADLNRIGNGGQSGEETRDFRSYQAGVGGFHDRSGRRLNIQGMARGINLMDIV